MRREENVLLKRVVELMMLLLVVTSGVTQADRWSEVGRAGETRSAPTVAPIAWPVFNYGTAATKTILEQALQIAQTETDPDKKTEQLEAIALVYGMFDVKKAAELAARAEQLAGTMLITRAIANPGKHILPLEPEAEKLNRLFLIWASRDPESALAATKNVESEWSRVIALSAVAVAAKCNASNTKVSNEAVQMVQNHKTIFGDWEIAEFDEQADRVFSFVLWNLDVTARRNVRGFIDRLIDNSNTNWSEEEEICKICQMIDTIELDFPLQIELFQWVKPRAQRAAKGNDPLKNEVFGEALEELEFIEQVPKLLALVNRSLSLPETAPERKEVEAALNVMPDKVNLYFAGMGVINACVFKNSEGVPLLLETAARAAPKTLFPDGAWEMVSGCAAAIQPDKAVEFASNIKDRTHRVKALCRAAENAFAPDARLAYLPEFFPAIEEALE